MRFSSRVADGGDEPGAVRGEGQPAQPRQRDVALEVVERGGRLGVGAVASAGRSGTASGGRRRRRRCSRARGVAPVASTAVRVGRLRRGARGSPAESYHRAPTTAPAVARAARRRPPCLTVPWPPGRSSDAAAQSSRRAAGPRPAAGQAREHRVVLVHLDVAVPVDRAVAAARGALVVAGPGERDARSRARSSGSRRCPRRSRRPRCWSAGRDGPSRGRGCRTSRGTSSTSPPMSVTPKNAWNAIVREQQQQPLG